ncbi:MAG: F0F1 ATP synthase subunit A [Candidatus Gastranaerophilales bacterium]|nr:F0F1 ATP synthase subunit A [Candidatus Gastranaerophilales bacterium]
MGEHWTGYIGNLHVHWDTLITMWFAMAVVILISFFMTRKLEIIPGKAQAIGESIMNFFTGNLAEVKDGNKHIPIVASLFLFILAANLMGQLPLRLIHLKQGEFASPTNDINLTAALAVLVLLYYLFQGFKEKGFKYIYHGFSITGIITTLVDILEMITRPLSLSLRLFANILAGEILVSVVLGLFAFAAPVPVMLFEIFVAFIQAFVFMMLTIAYITSAVSQEE